MKNRKRFFIAIGLTALVITSLILISGSSKGVDNTLTESVLGINDFPQIDSYYNYPYGEIFVAYRSGFNVTLEVYNTTGVEQYLASKWLTLDSNILKKELRAERVQINAPRFWIVDSITGIEVTSEESVYEISNIRMQKLNVIDAGSFGSKFNQGAYELNTINTSAQFTWNAGTEVYELTSPSGEIYRMQAYSQSIDSSINIVNLAELGSKLHLKEGWAYNARVLDSAYTLSENKTTLIADEFMNTYLLID